MLFPFLSTSVLDTQWDNVGHCSSNNPGIIRSSRLLRNGKPYILRTNDEWSKYWYREGGRPVDATDPLSCTFSCHPRMCRTAAQGHPRGRLLPQTQHFSVARSSATCTGVPRRRRGRNAKPRRTSVP